jgi:hypothetical protein
MIPSIANGVAGSITRIGVTQIGRAAILLCTGATILVGCPMYSVDCDSRDDCATGFYCDRFSQRCQPISQGEPVGCTRPDQCAVGETCTRNFECLPGSCDYHGCASGYICAVVDSAHTCVANMGDAGPGTNDAGPLTDAGVSDAGTDAAVRDASVDASQ